MASEGPSDGAHCSASLYPAVMASSALAAPEAELAELTTSCDPTPGFSASFTHAEMENSAELSSVAYGTSTSATTGLPHSAAVPACALDAPASATATPQAAGTAEGQ